MDVDILVGQEFGRMRLYLIVAVALLLFEIPPSLAQSQKGSSTQPKSAPASPQTAQPAQPPATAAPAASEPQATTASFGDWVLRCQRVGTGSEARRSCEMVQSVMLKGQKAPVAQLAFGKATPTGP